MSAVIHRLPIAVRAVLWPVRPTTCDWGGCHAATVSVRYSPECGPVDDERAWLGVCAAHAERPGNDDYRPRGPEGWGGGRRCP